MVWFLFEKVMNKNIIKLLFITILYSIILNSMISFAGHLSIIDGKAVYYTDDGIVAKDTWIWLDDNNDGVEELYRFDNLGFIANNYTHYDGKMTNDKGQLLEKGVVVRRIVGTGKVITNEDIEYGPKIKETENWINDEMTNDISISNADYEKYGAKGLHTALDDKRLNLVTITWWTVCNSTQLINMPLGFIEHSSIMLNYYTEELQRIKNIKSELGNENVSSNTNFVGFNNALKEAELIGNTPTSIPPDNAINSGTIIYDRELIKAIVSVAKFYINHIPTYQGKLKTRVRDGSIVYDENDLAINHLKDNLRTYTNVANTNTIEYSDDHKIKTIKTYENGTLKDAKREFNRIDAEEGKPMYQTANSSGNNMGYYKWKDIINDDSSYNVNTKFSGWEYTKDDCSGSIELVLNIRESD